MTINRFGFLTRNPKTWERVRSDAVKSASVDFAFANKLNALAMQMLLAMPARHDGANNLWFARLGFGKSLQAFQNAILLLERGAIPEARTLARLCAECVIVTGALVKDPDVFRMLNNDSALHIKKLSETRMNSPENSEDARSKARDKFDELSSLKGNDKPANLNLKELARIADLMGIYDTTYRYSSGDSAHATLISFWGFAKRGEESADDEPAEFGPKVERKHVQGTLLMLNDAMLSLLKVKWPNGDLTEFDSQVSKLDAEW